MDLISGLVARARAGDTEAFGVLVRETQTMACAAARAILRDAALAEDAVQDAYVRAFRRLGDLDEPAAFAGWLRRIVITAALNVRRSRRQTLLRLDDVPEIPVLDEAETSWSDAQRTGLAAALLTLTPDERQLCDRRYHGRWSTARLARAANVDEGAMRKRLQRVRDKLRKEVEMAEQRKIAPGDLRADLPEKVIELLARPKLTDLSDNPVGQVLTVLRSVYSDFTERELPETVDLAAARRSIADDALYIDPLELHRVDDARILRYDLTLPLLLNVQYTGEPLRIWSAGKVYRKCQADAMHLEAFHQAEALWMDERSRIDPWRLTALVLQSVDVLLPGRTVKIVPTRYPMCSQAWELEIESDGRWLELMAWGVFTDRIVAHLGGTPSRHSAMGVGYGLERAAMLRYGIDDARKVDVSKIA